MILGSQLAVVHGLVLNRIQELSYRQEVFRKRCCRASYGVLVKELYDVTKHVGEEFEISPYDKKKWAIKQVDWLIKQVRQGR
jgi:hypothetical protein